MSGTFSLRVVARLVTALKVRAMTAFPSSGALQSSLIDRVPAYILTHKAAYSQAMTINTIDP